MSLSNQAILELAGAVLTGYVHGLKQIDDRLPIERAGGGAVVLVRVVIPDLALACEQYKAATGKSAEEAV